MLLENALADFLGEFFQEDDTDCLTSNIKLQIHRDNYFFTLLKTLKSHYPLTFFLLGDNTCNQLGREYILLYPSLSHDLNDYGEYFAQYLRDHIQSDNLKYLHEITTIEWLTKNLPVNDNDNANVYSELVNIPEDDYEKLYACINPSILLIESQYPLLTIIESCFNKDYVLQVKEQPCYFLLHKSPTEINYYHMSDDQFTFFYYLSQEVSFKESFCKTLQRYPAFDLVETITKLAPIIIKNLIVMG